MSQVVVVAGATLAGRKWQMQAALVEEEQMVSLGQRAIHRFVPQAKVIPAALERWRDHLTNFMAAAAAVPVL
jgi:hypothetical protein